MFEDELYHHLEILNPKLKYKIRSLQGIFKRFPYLKDKVYLKLRTMNGEITQFWITKTSILLAKISMWNNTGTTFSELKRMIDSLTSKI